jgi:hypothetical protein
MRTHAAVVAVTAAILCTPITSNAQERFNRGIVAAVNAEGKPYIGWRLLKSDPQAVI